MSLGCHVGVNLAVRRRAFIRGSATVGNGRDEAAANSDYEEECKEQEGRKVKERKRKRVVYVQSRGIPDWQPTTDVSFTIIQDPSLREAQTSLQTVAICIGGSVKSQRN